MDDILCYATALYYSMLPVIYKDVERSEYEHKRTDTKD